MLLLFLGFAMMQRSIVLAKNNRDTSLKRTIITIVVGFFAFSSLGVWVMYGVDNWMSRGNTLPVSYLIFQSCLCLLVILIATSGSYGRLSSRVHIFLTLFIAIALYPFLGRFIKHDVFGMFSTGGLFELGFRDVAGATFIYSVAGWIALATLVMFGFRDQRVVKPRYRVVPSFFSTLLISIGLLTAIVAMSSLYDAKLHVSSLDDLSNIFASALVIDAVRNSLYASYSALVIGVLVSLFRFKALNVRLCTHSVIAGLVAISASSFAVDTWIASLIGACAAVFMIFTRALLKAENISDDLNIVPTYMISGIWGTVAVGLFANTELLGTNLNVLQQVSVQILGVSFFGLASFLPTSVLLWVLAKFNSSSIQVKPSKNKNKLKSRLNWEKNASKKTSYTASKKAPHIENVKATQALSVLTRHDSGMNFGASEQTVKVDKVYKEKGNRQNLETNFQTAIVVIDGRLDNQSSHQSSSQFDNQMTLEIQGTKLTENMSNQQTFQIKEERSAKALVTNTISDTNVQELPKRYPSKDVQVFIVFLEHEVKANKLAQGYTKNMVLKNLYALRNIGESIKFKEKQLAGSQATEKGLSSDILAVQIFSTALADSLSHVENLTDKITKQFVDDMYFASALHRISGIGVNNDDLYFEMSDYAPKSHTEFEKQSTLPYAVYEKAAHKAKKKLESKSFMRMCLDIARAQHEHWNGMGFSQGLRGEDIPLAARIVSLVGTYISLRTATVSRLSHTRASQYILMNSMKQFDPVVVHHFFRVNELFEDLFAESFVHANQEKYVLPSSEQGDEHTNILEQKL